MSSNESSGDADDIASLRAITVLIVDDNPDDIAFAKRALDELDLQIVVQGVGSAKEMISYLQGEGIYSNRGVYPYPNLILLDLKMPEMDGFEALTWLRAHPNHAKAFVVVLTIVGEWRQVERAYQLGARSFLTKPFRASDFVNTIKALGLAR